MKYYKIQIKSFYEDGNDWKEVDLNLLKIKKMINQYKIEKEKITEPTKSRILLMLPLPISFKNIIYSKGVSLFFSKSSLTCFSEMGIKFVISFSIKICFSLLK